MLETYFAPAARTAPADLASQIKTVSMNPVMTGVLDAANGLLVVLNEMRQVVAINHAFLDALGIEDAEKALGLRLGEALHCVHSAQPPNGCGTTPFCATCGAAIAMMTAIEANVYNEQICALTTEQDGETRDQCLAVRAKPLTVNGDRWILIYAQDISEQQFWVTLERLFFHDINNFIAAITMNCHLLEKKLPEVREVEQINKACSRLRDEISMQRSLSQRRDAQYRGRREKTTGRKIRAEMNLILSEAGISGARKIEVQWPDTDVELSTDILLVTRVLNNMLVNALEATEENGTVRLTTVYEPDHVVWEVWNRSHIPPLVQKRIFQRHFSTKSTLGRGLGTYSMKLFGEKYLGGEVTFVSTESEGTTFRLRLPYSG